MCFDATCAAAHRNGSSRNIQTFERAQHKRFALSARQLVYQDFQTLHRLKVLQFLVRCPAGRISNIGRNIVFIAAGRCSPEPDHNAVANFLTAMPVANAILQNPIEKWRPLIFRAGCVIPGQLDHRFLYEIKRLISIAHSYFGQPQCPAFNLYQKLIKLPFVVQRVCSRRWLAGARYRKNTRTSVHRA